MDPKEEKKKELEQRAYTFEIRAEQTDKRIIKEMMKY